MSSKKIIIVGGGIVGFSTAYYLNKAGHDVTIVDQTDGQNNCSFGNAGYVSPSHMVPLASPGIISQGLKWMLNSKSPFYIKPRLDLDLIKWGLLFKKASTSKRVKQATPVLHQLTVRSQALYEEILQQESIQAGYQKEGLLMVCQTEEALKHEIEVVEIAESLGLEASALSREETQKLDPNVEYNMAGAVYFGCDGWMTPDVFMQQFQKVLQKKGVNLLYKTQVNDLLVENGIVVGIKTQEEILKADEYIIAAGTWSSQLMKKLGIFMPLQGGKGV
jgi:D-amino-acid dehydrogenase